MQKQQYMQQPGNYGPQARHAGQGQHNPYGKQRAGWKQQQGMRRFAANEPQRRQDWQRNQSTTQRYAQPGYYNEGRGDYSNYGNYGNYGDYEGGARRTMAAPYYESQEYAAGAQRHMQEPYYERDYETNPQHTQQHLMQQPYYETHEHTAEGHDTYGESYGAGRYAAYGEQGESWNQPARYYGNRNPNAYATQEQARNPQSSYGSAYARNPGSYGGANYDEENESRRGQRFGREYSSSAMGSSSNYSRNDDEGMNYAQTNFRGHGPKGYQRSDDRIKEDICDALAEHAEIDASEIEIKVDSGVVTLEGSVDQRRAKRLAEDIAERVRGVKDVQNQLKTQDQAQQKKATASTSASSSTSSSHQSRRLGS